MKKILVMPDSFKGSLSAQRFCEVTESVLRKYFPDCEIKSFPMADGGEGTTDCFLGAGGFEKVTMTATDAFGDGKEVYYALNGDTRVMEMAMCASLPSAKGRENPAVTTTYGVGEMMRHAVKNGVKHILVGLGGSCTNDAGAGMARGAGVKFYDAGGNEFTPVGETLDRIAGYDTADFNREFRGVEITAMCDIDNPLYGEKGAAYVFAPQKGADAEMVKMLDRQLESIAQTVYKKTGISYNELKGAGAAGGMGFGVCAFLGGSLKSGTDAVLDIYGFENEAADADLIITGEGRLDAQSMSGKAVVGIARRAKKCGVPVAAIVGAYTEDYEKVYDEGVTAVFTTNHKPQTLGEATADIEKNLASAIENTARLLKIQKG